MHIGKDAQQAFHNVKFSDGSHGKVYGNHVRHRESIEDISDSLREKLGIDKLAEGIKDLQSKIKNSPSLLSPVERRALQREPNQWPIQLLKKLSI